MSLLACLLVSDIPKPINGSYLHDIPDTSKANKLVIFAWCSYSTSYITMSASLFQHSQSQWRSCYIGYNCQFFWSYICWEAWVLSCTSPRRRSTNGPWTLRATWSGYGVVSFWAVCVTWAEDSTHTDGAVVKSNGSKHIDEMKSLPESLERRL